MMVRLSAIWLGERSVDVGSGSGRIVFAFASAGACAYGYEINLLLVLWSRFISFLLGWRGYAFFTGAIFGGLIFLHLSLLLCMVYHLSCEI